MAEGRLTDAVRQRDVAPPDADDNHATYTVRRCASCLRVEASGGEARSCRHQGRDAELVEIEVIPVSTVEGWHRDLARLEEKIQRINVDLASVLSSDPGSSNGGASGSSDRPNGT